MINWEYYSKRRNILLPDFIKSRDVESYESLIDHLLKMGISPPPKGMFQSAYAIAFPPVPKVKPKPRTARKPAPVSVSKEVKESPAAKPKRTRNAPKKKLGSKSA
tara:strand:- start:4728 stop:5042 length:315 start_codon:yes stop_codon:yes gene_type:complete